MIIAMITMRVVQPAVHEIVDVVAVRDCCGSRSQSSDLSTSTMSGSSELKLLTNH
jgi:hypothetical protein